MLGFVNWMWPTGSHFFPNITTNVYKMTKNDQKLPIWATEENNSTTSHQKSLGSCFVLGSFSSKLVNPESMKKTHIFKSLQNFVFVISCTFRGRWGITFDTFFLKGCVFCEKGWYRESDGIYIEFEGLWIPRASRKQQMEETKACGI